MEDERRKFLRELLALGGGAAILPELVEAAQSDVKLQRPITPRILKRESTKSDPFLDSTVEVEMLGANGVRQLITFEDTEYDSPSIRRHWTTMRADLFETASAATPVHSNVIGITSVSRKIDANHEEITVTTVMSGKTSRVGPQVMAVPANRISGEGMSDEELIDKFLMPKLAKVQP
jgi:hypothetical protein